MRLRAFLVCKTLAIFSLICALESNELSFPFLEVAHSTNRQIRLGLTYTADYYAQAAQDKFVYMILYGLIGKQDQGYYLETGAGHPININNSYFFEKELKWSGVSIDISQRYAEEWHSVRDNLLLHEDATKSDYSTILQSFPKVIDYLSVDLNKDCSCTDILKNIPFKDYTFKVITVEHDFYRCGDDYREEERQILKSFGYHLLCSDVSVSESIFTEGWVMDPYLCSFEDWWIHPSFFSSSELSLITSLDLEAKDYEQLIQELQVALE